MRRWSGTLPKGLAELRILATAIIPYPALVCLIFSAVLFEHLYEGPIGLEGSAAYDSGNDPKYVCRVQLILIANSRTRPLVYYEVEYIW